MAPLSLGLNFAALPSNGVRLDTRDLQIDAERFLKAAEVRLDALDMDHSLARYSMGVSLKADAVNETFEEAFQGQHPQILDDKGDVTNSDDAVGWLLLIQHVRFNHFEEFKRDGRPDPEDKVYRCRLGGNLIQITQKQKTLIRLLQLTQELGCPVPDRHHARFFTEDVRKEEEIASREEARCEELLEYIGNMHKLTTSLRDKLRIRAQDCREWLGVQALASQAVRRAEREICWVKLDLEEPKAKS